MDASGIHGEKDQDERNNSIKEFREGVKDVLIATDIVSKGLDFQNIEHVINYDMPKEVSFYVYFYLDRKLCLKDWKNWKIW